MIGPFEDQYEIATKCTRATAVDCISAAMLKLGSKVSGRAYDGAIVFSFSSRPPHEVSFYGHEVWCYVQEGSVVLKDAFSGWRLSLRLWPSLLRRRLPAIARDLQ